jgi:flagellar motor switch protein FliM
MKASTNKLSRENLRQLLASVGSMASDVSAPAYTEFDWHACRCFSREQLEQLSTFVQPLGPAMAETLEGFCRQSFEVTVQPVQQASARTLMQEVTDSGAASYLLLLGRDTDEPCGAFWMPAQTARVWAQLLLGDSDPADDSGERLSSLEESLLCDLATACVGALGAIHPVFDLQSEAELASGELPEHWDPSEAFVKIVQTVKPTDAEHATEAVLMLPCSSFAEVVGHTAGGQAAADTDYSSLIMANMHGLPVSMQVQLSRVVLTLEQLMSLRVDDVLVLDQRIDQCTDVILDERVVFRAVPGKKQGKQAVLITECVAAPH